MKKKSCLTEFNIPDSRSGITYNACEYSVLNSKKNKIGILGGTFNPIHLGHIKMGMDAHNEFSLSKVLYIPTAQPPHKENDDIASNVDRLSMLDLALTMPYMQASDIELNRSGTTYTIDTLNELNKLYSNSEFYYIIGSDTLFTLNTWKSFFDVLTLSNFIVFIRDNDDIRKVSSCIDFYNSLNRKKICLAINPGLDISSTKIRNNIKNNLSLDELLPKQVAEYIKKNRIY